MFLLKDVFTIFHILLIILKLTVCNFACLLDMRPDEKSSSEKFNSYIFLVSDDFGKP